jgi:hypothetical protein
MTATAGLVAATSSFTFPAINKNVSFDPGMVVFWTKISNFLQMAVQMQCLHQFSRPV